MKSFLSVDLLPASYDPRGDAAPASQRIGADLKTMFDNLTAGPMPERLLQLADALEDAFQRGELFETKAKLDA